MLSQVISGYIRLAQDSQVISGLVSVRQVSPGFVRLGQIT
jgi:hypothetical protein